MVSDNNMLFADYIKLQFDNVLLRFTNKRHNYRSRTHSTELIAPFARQIRLNLDRVIHFLLHMQIDKAVLEIQMKHSSHASIEGCTEFVVKYVGWLMHRFQNIFLI